MALPPALSGVRYSSISVALRADVLHAHGVSPFVGGAFVLDGRLADRDSGLEWAR